MTQPTGRKSDGTWIAADSTERNAIGSNEALAVGDLARQVDDGILYECATVAGANSSTWAAAPGGGDANPSVYDKKPVKLTAAAISAASIAAPTGLWNLDQTLVEEMTGGAGYDLSAGFDGVMTWENVDGLPGAGDELSAGWFDGESSIELSDTNPGSTWNIDTDLTISCWVRQDAYDAEGGDNDPYVAVTYVNRSSTTLGSTTWPPYRLGLNPRVADGAGNGAFAGYYDTAGAFTSTDWDDGTRRIKSPKGKWVHLAMTRIRNGVDDNDLTLFVNGEQVNQITAQIDCALPSSSNMRLQFGQGRGGINGFTGSIRDVALWTSRLTPAEIQTIYQIGVGE